MRSAPQPARPGQTGGGVAQGAAVEVTSQENRLLCTGLVNRLAGGALYIRSSTGAQLPVLVVNLDVKLRFLTERGGVMLQGKVGGSTASVLKVDRLKPIAVKEQRAFFRQSISVRVGGWCTKLSEGGTPVPESRHVCRVLDISAGGMLVSSEVTHLEGEHLLISDIKMLPQEEPLSFYCLVRRVSQWDKGEFRFGCQFERLGAKDQDRLLQVIFAVQREELRRRKNG